MKIRPFYLTIVAMLLLIGVHSSTGLLAKEKKITRKDLPSSVLNSFQKAYPAASIKGLSKEVEHNTTYYEIESLDGNTRRDILYTAEGKAYEIEETIVRDSLPEGVKTILRKEFSKAKLVRAEKVTRGSSVGYEVTISEGKKTREITFDAEGALISPKPKADGKSEKDDDDDEDDD